MVLPTSGTISISDINSCARFTNGNMGINTTSPNYNLDINGTLKATTITTGTILATTSVSSGALHATNSTVTNAVSTNVSSGTLNLSTGLTAGTILATTSVSSGALHATNSTVTNAVSTNASSGTLNLSTGLTAGTILATTSISSGAVNATNSTVTNSVATNSSISNLVSSNSTIANIFSTLSSIGTLRTDLGVMSDAIMVKASILTSLTVPNLLASTSISSGALHATNSTVTNFVATSITAGPIFASNNVNASQSIVVQNTNSGSSAYSALTVATDQSNFNIFKNSSTRTADGGANTTTIRNDGGALRLQSNTGMGIWVGSTGNVGINTTVPGSPLDVKGDSTWGLTRLAPTTSGGETAIGFFALNDFTASGQATSGNWLLGTGINNGGASNFNLLRNTTNILTVVTNGNVGIGTTSPTAKLNVSGSTDLFGNLRVGGSSSSTGFNIDLGTSGVAGYRSGYLYGDGTTIYLTNQQVGGLNFGTNNAWDRMVITAAGNVGIGNASPSFPLDVNGTIRNRSSINGANGASIENPNSGSSAYSILTLATDQPNNFNIFKNSTTRTSDGGANTTTIRNDGGPLRLQSNTGMGIWVGSTGNVGINTTSPSTMLELNDSGNSGVDFLKMYQPNLATGGSTRILLGKSDDLYGRANITFKNANNNYTNHLGMGVFPYDSALIINSQGWVGMGTTNPSVKLEVIGNTLIKGGVLKVHDGSDAYGGFEVKGTNGSYIDFGPPGFNYRSRIIHLESEFSLNFIVNSGIYNTFAMTLASTGNVGLGTTTPIAKLHVNGSAVIDGSAVINGGSLAVKNGPSGWTGFELQGSNASYIDFGPDTIDFRSRIVHQESDRSLTFTVNGSTTAIQIASTGRVTIGGSNGSYPLTVFGSSNSGSIGGYAGWYNVYGWQNQTTSYDVSIYSQNFIMAGQGFVSVSDQRIKKDIIEIEDGESLSILRQIEPKRYRYIDEYKRGTDYVYGFIAQQVRGVLPAASGLVKDFIPSIMTLATVSYDSTNDITTVTLVDNKQHNLTSENSNSRVRFFDENDQNTELELHEIVSDDIFKVKGELKGVNTFVYGVEVDDFHTLNKDAIFTVAVSALQQVDKELQETKQKVSNLETELTTLQQQYQDMLARIINLELK